MPEPVPGPGNLARLLDSFLHRGSPHSSLADFQQSWAFRDVDPCYHEGGLPRIPRPFYRFRKHADHALPTIEYRWPFSFRWRMCHPCSTSRTGRALDDPHYLPGLHRESISQGVISCQWRLDLAGDTGGDLSTALQVATFVALILHRLSQRFVRQTSRVDASHAVTSEAIARATRAGRCSEPNESKHPTIRA